MSILQARRSAPKSQWNTGSKGYLFGLTLANGTDATNDIDIAAGTAADANGVLMTLSATLTKQLDAAWAVGTNAGGRDTGAIANGTWHVWVIQNPDTAIVDALFSTSASAPTMPTGYTRKRRIGSILREGGAIVAFVQDGDHFTRSTPAADISAANPGTSAVTRALSVPTGIRVEAVIAVYAFGSSAAATPAAVYISDLSVTDNAASVSNMSMACFSTAVGRNDAGSQVRCFTDTSGQVRSRVQVSAAGTTLDMSTLGWIDTRGRLA